MRSPRNEITPRRGRQRLVVELAGLVVEGGSLLDGAEAGDAKSLTGLLDGRDPAGDVLVRALAGGVGLAGDHLSPLVLHEHGLGVLAVGVVAGASPDLSPASTDANTTSHLGFCVKLRARACDGSKTLIRFTIGINRARN